MCTCFCAFFSARTAHSARSAHECTAALHTRSKKSRIIEPAPFLCSACSCACSIGCWAYTHSHTGPRYSIHFFYKPRRHAATLALLHCALRHMHLPSRHHLVADPVARTDASRCHLTLSAQPHDTTTRPHDTTHPHPPSRSSEAHAHHGPLLISDVAQMASIFTLACSSLPPPMLSTIARQPRITPFTPSRPLNRQTCRPPPSEWKIHSAGGLYARSCAAEAAACLLPRPAQNSPPRV